MTDYYEKAKKEVMLVWKKKGDQSVAHQVPHIEDVYNYAMFLAELAGKAGKKIDLMALKLAIPGHDLIQPVKGVKADHAANSTKGYGEILSKIGCPEDLRHKVLQIISEHSSEVINRPTSNEAKILYIADKWTGIGKKGIERVRQYCHERGLYDKKALDWYKEKMKKAMPLFLELIEEFPGSEIAIIDMNDTLAFFAEAEETQKF